MIADDTELRRGHDVFTRPEAGGRIFLQRPGGRRGPLTRLIRESGSTWWQKLDRGVKFSELPARADLEGFLLALHQDGFITSSKAITTGTPGSDAFEDPWTYQFSQPSLWSPWYVLWEITDKCSQHCAFCYNPERENVQVGLGQAQKTVEELVENQVPFVTLLGGEPLSNVHVEEIIRLLHAQRIYTKVITSGVPITAVKVQRLKAAGLDQIALSLDALTPELNDLTRGPDSFRHFARGRGLIGREIPCVTASLTVSTATLAQMPQLGDFCREWDLDDVYLSQLRDVDGIVYPPGIGPLSQDQVGEMNRLAAQLNQAGTKVIGVPQCSCGRSSAVLQPDGQLRACPFKTAPENPLVRGLSQTWARVAKRAETIGPVTSSSSCFKTIATS